MALKQFLSVSLAALTAAATPGGPAFPSAPPGDGAPTQESCAALGFPQAGGYEDRAPALPAYAPPPPPSPRISPPPPAPSIAQPGAPASVSDMSAQEHQILHIGLQGYDVARAERPPLNLVFLIDTSGSMASDDRLPLAKQALNLLIDQLRPQDRVAMVAYAGSAGAVLGPTDGRQK